MSWYSPRLAGYLLLACITLLACLLQWRLPHQAFWSNDGGEKLVQVKALAASGLRSPALPYDPLGLEPAGSFAFAPFLPGHARIVDGRLLSVVPVYFPLLSALPYALWGHAGLYLLPLLGTLLSLFCLLRLARDFKDQLTGPLIVAAAGASPLFFYGLTFWEHSLAAGLCTAGVLLLQRADITGRKRISYHALAAGLIMTLAAWLRGEVFILLLACGIAMLANPGHRRLLPSFLLGLAIALVPYGLINQLLYATAASPQLPGAGMPQGLSIIPLLSRWRDVAPYLLTAYLDLPVVNGLFFLLGVGPGLLLHFCRQPSPRRDALALCWCGLICLTALATLGRLFFLGSPLGSSMAILGLFGSLPLLPLALVRQDANDPEQGPPLRFLSLTALLCLAGLCLGLPSRGGLQWGPRYTLFLTPLLSLLAVTGFTRLKQGLKSPTVRRACTGLLLVMILTGAAIQGFGVHLLFAKKQATIANMDKIRALAPRVIITDTWWVPEDNAELYGAYPMYTFYTFAQMGQLLALLARKGEREVLLVSSADYREFIARQPGLALTSFQQTTHPGMSMFNLSLHAIRLGQPQ